MGCIIGGNIKNSSINIDQDPILTSKRIKQTLTIHNLFENPPSISSSILNHINNNNNNQRKSLFCEQKINSNNNLVKAKTNSSTILLNFSMELIMKFSKELNENYEIISIFQNNLKNLKDETIKITKEDPLHAIFSFGGEIKGKIKKDNSSSFQSSNLDELEEVDYLFDEENIQPHQFDIEFDEGKYYIKGYDDGSGIFLRIDKKINIGFDEKYIFLFNNKSFINFQIKEDNNLVYIEYNGEKKGEFNYKENNIILIGRSQSCNVVLNNEEGISRVQFSFYYDIINNEFYIFDGLYDEDKNKCKCSTNGIWLLINNKILINKGMLFKTGKTLILCELKENL